MKPSVKQLDTIEVVGGHPALDFVNTVHSWRADPPPDYLHDLDDFVDWNLMSGLLSRAAASRFKTAPAGKKGTVFTEVLALRANLHHIFVALTEAKPLPRGSLDHLNDVIRRTGRWRRLAAERNGGSTTFRFRWQLQDAHVIAVLGPVAWLAAGLLEKHGLERLKECPGDNCGWLFLDASKNRSRTWCSMKTCGNAAKVKRFRKRPGS